MARPTANRVPCATCFATLPDRRGFFDAAAAESVETTFRAGEER